MADTSEGQSSQSNDSIEIIERVDSGLYGSVYRGIQKPFNRVVAVKIIKTQLNVADALAEVMRRLGICEEKGSGIDKVVSAAELFQLPAPDFRVGTIRTSAILFSHQDFAEMTKSARVRACYQHCVLQFLSGKRMSNQSLRERFGLESSSGSATTSQIIAAAKEAKLIKLDDEGTGSLKYARYLPQWG